MKLWIILAAVNGVLVVSLGAFGAHGLETRLKENNRLATWQTAVHYQMFHTVALLGVAWLASLAAGGQVGGGLVHAAGWCMLVGIVLFSGSLYVLSLTNITKLGAITPFGGTLFIVGWILMLVAGVKLKT